MADDGLLEAVRGLHLAHPELGPKPLLAKLRQQQLDLAAGNKEVREALAALKAEESKAPEATAAAPPAAAAPSAAAAPPVEEGGAPPNVEISLACLWVWRQWNESTSKETGECTGVTGHWGGSRCLRTAVLHLVRLVVGRLLVSAPTQVGEDFDDAAAPGRLA